MIKTFRHKGLQRFHETSSTSGIQHEHAKRLRLLLGLLNTAAKVDDIAAAPGLGLHRLQGKRRGDWAVKVSGNWRVTFQFRDGNAYLLDYEDYH